MRVYRYQYKKKKKVNTALVVWLAGIVLFSLILQGKKEMITRIAKECKIICYEEILDFYMPGVVYVDTGGKDANALEQVLSHFFLLENEVIAVGPYDTQVESALSYEAILAREAADENYIDSETGEMVMTENTPDVTEEGAGEVGQSAEQTALQTGTGFSGTQEKQVTYSREKLNDFDYLVQNFYQVDSTTTIDGSQLNADALYGKDLRLSHDASIN